MKHYLDDPNCNYASDPDFLAARIDRIIEEIDQARRDGLPDGYVTYLHADLWRVGKAQRELEQESGR